MRRRQWQIPVILLLLLYHVLRAAVAWSPANPSPPAKPTRVPTSTPTPEYTAAPLPVAWIILPTNTPFIRTTRTPSPSPTLATATVPPATNTPTPFPSPQPELTPTPSPTTHTVASGETLSGIAKKYAVSVAALVAANQLPDPDRLSIGQVLVIPAGAPPTPTFAPTP